MPLSIRDFIHLRMSAGFTQDQLATRLELPRTAISKIEHGSRELTFDEALRWAEACGWSVLLTGRGQDEAAELLSALNGRRLNVALRMLALLRNLEDHHLGTLEALMGGWEKAATPPGAGDDAAQGRVKKL